MNQVADKLLDKVERLLVADKPQKALALLLDEPRDGDVEYDSALLGLYLNLEQPEEAVALLKRALSYASLYELCRNRNRIGFSALIQENGAFRAELVRFLIDRGSLDNFGGLVALLDDLGRKLLLDWLAKTADQIEDPKTAATHYAAVGSGWFVQGDWDRAWHYWIKALEWRPDLLKKVMAFCKRSTRLDKSLAGHRLKLIRLILAAGRKQEALSLLNALGLESRQNALKVLIEMNQLFSDEHDADVAALKYSLALHLEDGEILDKVIDGLQDLDDDRLFTLKKQAVLSLQDAVLKRRALLRFARLYMSKNSWKQASLILQGLHQEDDHPEITASIQTLLAEKPELPDLQFIAGCRLLNQGQVVDALKHFEVIQSEPAFQRPLRETLEAEVQQMYSFEVVDFLRDLYPVESYEAQILALLIVQNPPTVDSLFLKQLEREVPEEKRGPFLYYALLLGYSKAAHHAETYRVLLTFLRRFPWCSAEALQIAELLINLYHTDYSALIDLIDHSDPPLRPDQAWNNLAEQAAYAEEAGRRGSTGADSVVEVEGKDFDQTLEILTDLAESGRWPHAAKAVRKVANHFPGRLQPLLDFCDQQLARPGHEVVWTIAKMHLLLSDARFTQAIKLGQKAINDPLFQADLPEIYNLMGNAFDGTGHEAEALRYFCLASRQARFYEVNRNKLKLGIMPRYPHLLKEALNLAMLNEDQQVWQQLMKQWVDHRPQDLEGAIKAQRAFADQVATAAAFLDLAELFLKAGLLDQVHRVLDTVDLRDTSIREALIHLANLIGLRYPQDTKAKFLLGRYYLVQQETARAVDCFRTLVHDHPRAAETVYQYLRGYLKRNPGSTGNVHLYGLLIRIALDFEFTQAAVRLLGEFAHQDRASAESLADGIYRVLVRDVETHREALFEFMSLMHQWTDAERMLTVEEASTFGRHFENERLVWLQEAADTERFGDRAGLAVARIHFQMSDFQACREALARLKGVTFKREAAPLYEQLAGRVEGDIAFRSAAAESLWLAESEGRRKVAHDLWQVSQEDPHAALLAYCYLRECGEVGDFDRLLAIWDGKADRLYAELRFRYQELREISIQKARLGEEPPDDRCLRFLLVSGNRNSLLDAVNAHGEGLPGSVRTALEAAAGRIRAAALMAAGVADDRAAAQQYCHEAGLHELAVLLKPPGERLPEYLRRGFLRASSRPRSILLRYHRLCRHEALEGSLFATDQPLEES